MRKAMLVSTITLALGCGTDEPYENLKELLIGGDVEISVTEGIANEATAHAWFYQSYEPQFQAFAFLQSAQLDGLTVDTCQMAQSGSWTADIEYLDVGGVTLIGGGKALNLVPGAPPFDLEYEWSSTDPTSVAYGVRYDLRFQGSAAIEASEFPRALHLPRMPSITSHDTAVPIPVTAGSGLTVTWPAGVDADVLGVGAVGNNLRAWICHPRDDGSFTIPDSVFEDINDDAGFIVLSAMTEGLFKLRDRTVITRGVTVAGATYARN